MRIMTGYMLYDLIVEVVTPAVYDYAVLFHHIAGLLSHWHTLQTNDVASGWYTMMVYLAEGSTPILHVAWMMNTVGLADGLAFKLLTLALLVAFFVVRILVSPLLAYTYLAPANRHLYDGRDGVFYFQLCIVFAFAGLNFFWFYKLLTLVYRYVYFCFFPPFLPPPSLSLSQRARSQSFSFTIVIKSLKTHHTFPPSLPPSLPSFPQQSPGDQVSDELSREEATARTILLIRQILVCISIPLTPFLPPSLPSFPQQSAGDQEPHELSCEEATARTILLIRQILVCISIPLTPFLPPSLPSFPQQSAGDQEPPELSREEAAARTILLIRQVQKGHITH